MIDDGMAREDYLRMKDKVAGMDDPPQEKCVCGESKKDCICALIAQAEADAELLEAGWSLEPEMGRFFYCPVCGTPTIVRGQCDNEKNHGEAI